MIYLDKNIVFPEFVINVDNDYNNYILRIVTAAGSEYLFNLLRTYNNERYSVIKFQTGANIDQLPEGESTYFVYNADNNTDVNYSNKTLLTRGLIKIIS